MAKLFKFRDVSKKASNDLWMFSLTSVLLLVLIIFLGLWNANWDFNVILPGYGIWTKLDIAEVDVWIHARYVDGIKVTQDMYRATFDIGILVKGVIVQLLAFVLYFNERTRNLLKKALDVSYIVILKVIGKFKSLQADKEFRKLIFDLDLQEKTDTWKLLAGLKLEKHLQKETVKMSYERARYEKDKTIKISRKLKAFLVKEEELREKLTAEWINEHIKHINFVYPKVTVKMVLTGNTSVKIARMAIEDVNAIKARETRIRLVSNLLSLVFLIVIGSITSLSFRYNVWKAVLDVLIYSFPIVFAFIFAVLSANKIHTSKENELEDRLGYITKYTGTALIKETKKEVIEDIIDKNEINKLKKQIEIQSLEDKLKELNTKKE